MIEIRKTDTFANGLTVYQTSAHVRVFWHVSNDWQQEILEMLSLWGKAFRSYGSILARDIVFITKRQGV